MRKEKLSPLSFLHRVDVQSKLFLPSLHLLGRGVAVNICELKGESYPFERHCFNEEGGGIIFDWNANFLLNPNVDFFFHLAFQLFFFLSHW